MRSGKLPYRRLMLLLSCFSLGVGIYLFSYLATSGVETFAVVRDWHYRGTFDSGESYKERVSLD